MEIKSWAGGELGKRAQDPQYHLQCWFTRRLTELRKTITYMITYYYSRRMQSKVSKGKRCMGQSPRETRSKLPAIFSQWRQIAAHTFSSNNVWWHVHSNANRGSSPNLGVQSGDQSNRYGAPAWLTLAIHSSLPLSRGQTDMSWSRAPKEKKPVVIINYYIVSINYLAWPKSLLIQRYSRSSGYTGDPEIHSYSTM